MKNQTLIFIGRSGAGKGTQIKLLSERLKKESGIDVLYIEPGSGFREFIKGDSCTAKRASTIAADGKLQPSFLTIWLWANMFVTHATCNEHLILDGMPRRVSEAKVLESALKFYGHENPAVIFLDVSESWAITRLTSRGRADDTKESIEARMNWYESDAKEAMEYMEKNPYYKFIKITGEQSIDAVHEDICKALAL